MLRTLEILPFQLLWGALFVKAGYNLALFTPAYILVAILIAIRLVLGLRSSGKLDIASYTLLGWTLLAFLGCLLVERVGMPVPASVWFFGLVTMHFFVWYGDYFRRVMSNEERRTRYMYRVLVTNGVSVILALMFALSGTPILAILFSITFANAWALLHILTSLRPSVLRSSLGVAT